MPARPTLALIAAVARNGAIGRDGGLLWQEPADQRHFRATTLGCPVIMGRKTWDSLPARFRPLPGRRNLVVSRNPALQCPGAEVVASLPAALALLADAGSGADTDAGADAPKVFVIGGGELYAQALPLADELVLTEIDADLPGDTFFPTWDRSAFVEVSSVPGETADGTRYRFLTCRRG
jgi:dihydrofolate reductase